VASAIAFFFRQKVAGSPILPGLRPDTIRGAVNASLERLQTDHIDLLYFHSDDESVPIEESLAAASDLIQEGKVRFLGASNYTAQRLLEARIASAAGLPTFEAVTVEYSLMRREKVEGGLAQMAQAQMMGILPHFTLANGFLGRHRNIRSFNPNDIRARRASAHAGRAGTQVLRALDKVAVAHGVEISAIAVAWVLAQPGISVASIGPESIRELEALISAPLILLTPGQLSLLNRASGEGQRAQSRSRKK
jgi:aryl-alcohol dehydrogenase-like predicted oxidoreductase